MLKFFRNIEIEWKILLLAALLLSALAFPLQCIYINKLKTTLSQSIDPQLEALLRSFISAQNDNANGAIKACLERNRQWQALIPFIIEEQLFVLTLTSILLFISLLLLSFWSVKHLTKPLKDLANAADSIGKGHSVTIKKKSGGALGRLESSMLHMQDELIKLRERAHAQGMESAWRDIARVMAHEIKNPLTPIQLTLDRIQDRIENGSQLKQEELKKFVERIGTQVNNLERLVNDFRSFAKEPEPILTGIFLYDVIEKIAVDMKGLIETVITGDAFVQADSHLLYRALLNIWKNSNEANASLLNVTITNDSDCTILKISDNGSGIPDENLDSVWIPYVTFKKGGTGLGLPVVKRIIESMGATITMQSSTASTLHGVTTTITFSNMKSSQTSANSCDLEDERIKLNGF